MLARDPDDVYEMGFFKHSWPSLFPSIEPRLSFAPDTPFSARVVWPASTPGRVPFRSQSRGHTSLQQTRCPGRACIECEAGPRWLTALAQCLLCAMQKKGRVWLRVQRVYIACNHLCTSCFPFPNSSASSTHHYKQLQRLLLCSSGCVDGTWQMYSNFSTLFLRTWALALV
jgi:hypothetical protein